MAGVNRMSKVTGLGLIAASVGFLIYFGGDATGLPGGERAEATIDIAAHVMPPDLDRPEVIDISASAHRQDHATLAPAHSFDPPQSRFPASDEPFGHGRQDLLDGPLWSKWRMLAQDIARDMRALDACRENPAQCATPARRILAIMESAGDRTGRARLGIVNRAVNLAIKATSDEAQHGMADRWSAPMATFDAGRGDCEDYAIAKYVILRQLGVPAEDLRLVIVRDNGLRQDHAVLAARLDGRWLVLDNRRFTLVEDRYAVQYAPLFALDMDGVSRIAGAGIKRPGPRAERTNHADRAG